MAVFVQFIAKFWQQIDNGNVVRNIDFSISNDFCNSHFFHRPTLKFLMFDDRLN